MTCRGESGQRAWVDSDTEGRKSLRILRPDLELSTQQVVAKDQRGNFLIEAIVSACWGLGFC